MKGKRQELPKFRIAVICRSVAISWPVRALFTVEFWLLNLVQGWQLPGQGASCKPEKTFHFYTSLPRACPLSLLRLCTLGVKLLLYLLIQFHK